MIEINRLRIKDKDILIAYLHKIDNIFPDPMSSRVNIEAHAEKVLNRGVVFVAVENGEIVGVCLGYANDKENGRAYLGTLGVSEGYRSQKLGYRLVESIICYSREQGMKFISLHAHMDNMGAIRFYQNNGFKITEDLQKPYPQAIYLTKDL